MTIRHTQCHILQTNEKNQYDTKMCGHCVKSLNKPKMVEHCWYVKTMEVEAGGSGFQDQSEQK